MFILRNNALNLNTCLHFEFQINCYTRIHPDSSLRFTVPVCMMQQTDKLKQTVLALNCTAIAILVSGRLCKISGILLIDLRSGNSRIIVLLAARQFSPPLHVRTTSVPFGHAHSTNIAMEVGVNNNKPRFNFKTSHLMNQKCAAGNVGPNMGGKNVRAPFCSRTSYARCRKTSVFEKKSLI